MAGRLMIVAAAGAAEMAVAETAMVEDVTNLRNLIPVGKNPTAKEAVRQLLREIFLSSFDEKLILNC